MTTPLNFEFDGEEYTIEDPSNKNSWLVGLQSLMQEFANENYGVQHERWDSDFSDEQHKTFGRAVATAMLEYRKELQAANLNETLCTPWENVLAGSLYNALYGELGSDYDAHDHGLYSAKFTEIEEAIADAAEDFEAPVCDLEALVDDIRSSIREKMEELDDSTIYDSIGHLSIELMYVPGFDHEKHSIDDFDVNPNEFSKRAPSYGHQALLTLTRISIPDLLELTEVDPSDSDLIDAWLEMKEAPAVEGDQAPPISREKVLELIENASVSYALPAWFGSIEIKDLKKIDPSKPLEVTGGLIGLIDHLNGAGYVVPVAAVGKVVIQPSDCLDQEYNNSVKKICDLTEKSMKAKIVTQEISELTKTLQVDDNELSP